MSADEGEPEGVGRGDTDKPEHDKQDKHNVSLAEEATNAAEAPEQSEEAESHWGP